MSLIPFNRPYITESDIKLIQESIAYEHISGDGIFTKKSSLFLEKLLEVPRALLTTSCTHALEMAAMLLDIKSGDEIIVPSFTFVSTVNAFVIRGAHPVFIDIRPDTLNMNECHLEDLISSSTKAIIPVHYAGVGCEMEKIMHIAKQYKIPVVEDNAHGLFGKYKGKWLGTFGCMATQSFHETKNITCGEGGALLINDLKYNRRAEIIREKGTNRNSFFRGQIDKYSWVDIGSSYLPSDILAAVLYSQLERWERIQSKRCIIWNYYYNHLRDWAEEQGVRLPIVPDHCDQAYHMFYMLMPSINDRQALINHLKQKRITAIFHYLPLHASEMGLKMGYKKNDFPVTEDVSDRLVRLPFYNNMTKAEMDMVVREILNFRCNVG